MTKVATFIAEHFKENVLPLGYKAFVVAVDREACAKYKQALDKLLPPEWAVPVYTENAADVVDRPLVAELQLSEEREEDTGLTPKAFAAFWAVRDETALKQAGIDPLELGKEIEKLLARFPNFLVNADEQRQLRAALYRPLITLARDNRTRVVDRITANLLS